MGEMPNTGIGKKRKEKIWMKWKIEHLKPQEIYWCLEQRNLTTEIYCTNGIKKNYKPHQSDKPPMLHQRTQFRFFRADAGHNMFPRCSLRYWISSFAIPPKFLWIKQGKEKKNYIYRYTIPWKQHRLTEPLCQNCKSIPLAIFPVFLTHNWGKRKSKGKKWEINIRGQHSKNLELLYSVFRGIQITGHCIAVLNTCALLSHV